MEGWCVVGEVKFMRFIFEMGIGWMDVEGVFNIVFCEVFVFLIKLFRVIMGKMISGKKVVNVIVGCRVVIVVDD